jgi:hypothetical protein
MGNSHLCITGIAQLDLIARLAALVPRPRLNLTRFHGVFAPNFKHRARIVPRRLRGKVDRDQPVAPMSWPLPHILVLRGTGTSCPMGATPQACLRHAPGHPLLMLRINSPCRHRDLPRLWWNTAGHCLHRRPAADCEDPRACTIARGRGRNSGARSADAGADCIETDMS